MRRVGFQSEGLRAQGKVSPQVPGTGSPVMVAGKPSCKLSLPGHSLAPPGRPQENQGGQDCQGLGSESGEALNLGTGYFTNGKCEAQRGEGTCQRSRTRGDQDLFF